MESSWTALVTSVRQMVQRIRNAGLANELDITSAKHLQQSSLFDSVDSALKNEVLRLARNLPPSDNRRGLRRAVSSMVGMAVADGLGHNFEFLDVQDRPDPEYRRNQNPFFEYPCPGVEGGRFHNPYNQFQLQPGQWTDDASMGLCLSDSLIGCNGYNGSNVRLWFFNWWHNGLNNAFRRDTERLAYMPRREYCSLSVGLGGNIAQSLRQMGRFSTKAEVPPRFEADTEDAGNGSLMRLAPVPIFFHRNIEEARKFSFESSLTTHPGPLASEACAFMAHLIVRALSNPSDVLSGPTTTTTPHEVSGHRLTAAAFIDNVVAEYLTLLDAQIAACADDARLLRARTTMRRLLLANEPDSSTERCWNWRSESLGLVQTLRNRGRNYNGYPVSPGYFGAFSMDGLSMALHCVYHSTSLNDAIARVVNLAGDADTTGSICAQMAGAIYGETSPLDPVWVRDLNRWDECEIELRAVLLYVMRDEESS
eukprot:gnl/Spiro4/2002_TR958_c0_g1_i1.p1 gnl/Spiro4/2002_TR958_c0_g1~~gnl/Spiro4/2002_TR958_c0_g1_i1.p1  ORF type:complete len:481 (-),score=128.54 gnl/Spiro4/2002_TR958_c0_g1_i1:126-1568(-)